jgi:hypothetical protein
VANLRQVIVVVDVDPKFDLLQLRPGRLLIFLLLRNVVTEFSEIDDLADGRIRGWCDLHQVESHVLSFFDRLGQLHDAELFAVRGENDADFARANPTVYTYLLLQNELSPAGDEGVRLTPSFFLSQSPARSGERAALRNLCACEERSDRFAVSTEPTGSCIRHRDAGKAFLSG